MLNRYYYLQIQPTNNIENIKNAYKKIVKIYHPDRKKDNNDEFINIIESYKYIIENINEYYNYVIENEEYYDVNINLIIDLQMKDLIGGINKKIIINKIIYYYDKLELKNKIIEDEIIININNNINYKQKYIIKNRGHIFNQITTEIKGNIIIDFNLNENKDYKIFNNNLFTNIDITLYQSLFGFNINKKYIDNTLINITNINKEDIKIIQPHKIYKIKDYGICNKNNIRGDLYIQFKVIFPNKLDENKKQIFLDILGHKNKNNKNDKKYLIIEEDNMEMDNIYEVIYNKKDTTTLIF